MTLSVDIQFRDARWKATLTQKVIRDACNAAAGKKKAEVTVVLAGDAFVKQLNREFRGKDKPTNVLSFPGEGIHLGDIVLARQTIAREAKSQGKTFADHALHLVVHGMLHLQGFDHENDQDAKMMEAQEVKILKKLGVNNPYL